MFCKEKQPTAYNSLTRPSERRRGKCLNENKVHAWICRVAAHGGKWRNCLLIRPAQNLLIHEQKVTLQIPEVHSQCWATLICTRVTSTACASGSLSSYQIQTEEMRQVGCALPHCTFTRQKCNLKITYRITHNTYTFQVPCSVATLDKKPEV